MKASLKARLHPCEAALASLPERLLVAVSGGVDSVALLTALVRSGRKPVVLHFNHGWRRESAVEAESVRELAAGHGLEFTLGCASPGKQTESAARLARYAFFAASALQWGIPALALGHHADDQVETFLLQLLRGSGAGGRGMESLTHRAGLTLHRPWLALWKADIVAYARRHQLAWSEDASNANPHHRRNLVRQRLLPYLAKLAGADTPQKLWRAAEIARAEGEWMDAICATISGSAELPVAELRRTPLAQQRRTILRWLQAHGIGDVNFADVEAVRGLLENLAPARINLSRGKFARRRAGRIFVE